MVYGRLVLGVLAGAALCIDYGYRCGYGFGSVDGVGESVDVAPNPHRISILTYNVENLFDGEHDQGTDDFTYLPLARKSDPLVQAGCAKNFSHRRRKECTALDWNEATIRRKLERVAAVIRQNGNGPDIAVLVEVENAVILQRLRDQYLKKSDYKTAVLIDGFDPRGIDPAVLSRFPLWRKPQLHRLPLQALDRAGEHAARGTRGVLEVPILLPDGTKAIVLAVHLPSQANPTYLRAQAIDFLNRKAAEFPSDIVVVAAGDFNISRAEEQANSLFSTRLQPHWQISHFEGCAECKGTHHYRREWSFLDAILVRRPSGSVQSATVTWRLDPRSPRVPHASEYQVNRYGTPARFEPRARQADAPGVSDHWPVYAELVKAR